MLLEFFFWNALALVLVVDVVIIVTFSRWVNRTADALIKRLD